MARITFLFSVISLFLFSVYAADSYKPKKSSDPVLYEGLGDYEMPISSNSELAQQYFQQGLMLQYGYNYAEAARSYEMATRCDPNSAVCQWALAIAAAECMKKPGDPWCVKAYEAIQNAEQLTKESPTKEQELVATITDRLVKNGEKYSVDNMSFVKKMEALHERYPDDPDIAAIYANSYMQQVNMYEDMINGKPTGAAKKICDTIEDGLKKHPYHPGLLHFYIHAMENCGTPKKAITAAERLDGLVPGSGHLQHMPAHIYKTYGRYHDASEANQRGVDADTRLFAAGAIKDPDFAGFYLHNHFYLYRSLMMEGRSKDALKQANILVERLQSGDLPSDPYHNNVFFGAPYLLMARFGMWDEIETVPPPSDNLLFAQGAYYYAKGISQLKAGDLHAAQNSLQSLVDTIKKYDSDHSQPGFSLPLYDILEMTYLDLDGLIAAYKGNYQKQIKNLKNALKIEEQMYLGMLPWYMPIRHALGAAYLNARQPKEAEKVFLEDLKEHPKNGWAIYGLIQSIRGQHRQKEVAQRAQDFQDAWKYADFSLESSRG